MTAILGYGSGLYGVGLYGFSLAPVDSDRTVVAVGDGSITFGETDALGVYWSIQAGSDPFGNAPAPRDQSGDRATGHGSWNATEFYGPRSWPITMNVHAPDHATLHQARHRLNKVCGLATFPVAASEPFYGVRLGRFRRIGELMWTEESPKVARVSMTLIADDPFIRGTARTVSAALAASSGGLSWPATWPATWSGIAASGVVSLTNNGTENADVRWRIDGPITNPAIVEVDTGRTLRTNLTLNAGQWLTLDTAAHRALANGDQQASRRDKVFGDWWDLEPGTTRGQLIGSGTGPATSLTATYNDTWL